MATEEILCFLQTPACHFWFLVEYPKYGNVAYTVSWRSKRHKKVCSKIPFQVFVK